MAGLGVMAARAGGRGAERGVVASRGPTSSGRRPPYLRDLVEATLETVFLAVVDGGAVVYVYKGPRLGH